MTASGQISDRERAKVEFTRDGFAVLRGFANAAEIAALNACIDSFIERVPAIEDTVAFYEQPGEPETIMRLQLLERHEPQLRELFHSDRYAGLAAWLLDEQVVPKAMQWFAKPPQIGKLTPPHQDGYYWQLEPSKALTLWLSLDQIDEVNGCVRYLPGSHLQPLREHRESNVLGFSKGIVGYGAADTAAERAVVTAPGDLIAHHANVVHRADPNPSSRRRRALGLVYFAASARQSASVDADRKRVHEKWREQGRA